MREKKKEQSKTGVDHNVKIHVQLTLVDRIINKYSPNKG